MQRRTLLTVGALSAALLALSGGAWLGLRPGMVGARLTPAGRDVFAAVGRAVLDGWLPSEPAARAAALQSHLDRLDDTIAGLAPSAQQELAELATLLANAPGRMALMGLTPAWVEATTAELQGALQDLKTSRLALRRQAYHALRDLTSAAYFAEAGTWAQIGYPGPRPV